MPRMTPTKNVIPVRQLEHHSLMPVTLFHKLRACINTGLILVSGKCQRQGPIALTMFPILRHKLITAVQIFLGNITLWKLNPLNLYNFPCEKDTPSIQWNKQGYAFV